MCHGDPLSWSNWNLEVGFCRGQKTGEPGDKPSEQDENQQHTQLTSGTQSESNPGHLGKK